LRVVHIESLEAGWLGKCHALQRGTEHAAGEWFFFVDSDVKLQPEALGKMLAYAIDRKIDALSIMTTVETHRFIEKMMLPLLAATWASMFAADQTNEDSEPDRAVANGQVFLIRAEAYRRVGGHACVKDRIVEDVELMRTLKKQGFKTRFLAGRHLASTRMHTHLRQMFHGWARIFAGTSRGRTFPMIAAIAFFIVCLLPAYPAIIYGIIAHDIWWLAAGMTHWLLVTIIAGLVWVWSGNSPAHALLLPISVPIEIAILAFSVRRAISGKVEWRGMSVDLRETSAPSDSDSAGLLKQAVQAEHNR
jgi:cellulose synthase/poly-beta-1,6-N-acetylglucosamine synthase-like glycosyltransferase